MTDSWSWITIPGERPEQPLLDISMTIHFDPLSLLLILTATFTTVLISISAWTALREKGNQFRFYAEVALLLFATVMLLLSGNFVQLFLFWQLSTFAAFLLIAHGTDRPVSEKSNAAARKFLLVNWIADAPLVIGICLIWTNFGTLEFAEVFSGPLLDEVLAINPNAVAGICFCLFVGVIGRCAQVPLCNWIFDASTTTSVVAALVQCATIMPTGVYLILRCTPLFEITSDIQTLMMVIGGLTAFLAAAMALTATDSLQVFVFCSSSLFGLMFVGLGSGTHIGLATSLLLLLTHSVAMALLIPAADDDIPLFARPAVRWGTIIGGFILATGLWGQNAILSILWDQEPLATGQQLTIGSLIIWPVMLSMFLLSIAIFRIIFSVDFPRKQQSNSENSAGYYLLSTVQIPMLILTVAAVSIGPILGGLPFVESKPLLNSFLSQSSLGDLKPVHVDLFTGGIGLLASLLGIVVAWMIYGNTETNKRPEQFAQMLGPFVRLSQNRFYIDEFYHLFLVIPLRLISRILSFLEWLLIDEMCLKTIVRLPSLLAYLLSPLQNGLVQFYALSMMLTAAVLLFVLLYLKV